MHQRLSYFLLQSYRFEFLKKAGKKFEIWNTLFFLATGQRDGRRAGIAAAGRDGQRSQLVGR